MKNAALRIQTLIDDLLAYSRTNATDRKFERRDLSNVLQEVEADFQDELAQKDASIETRSHCEVDIIPFQFRQLLQNLISNSLKLSSPERPLEIKIAVDIADAETFLSGKLPAGVTYCRIRFADNGIGFEQKYSDKIFRSWRSRQRGDI